MTNETEDIHPKTYVIQLQAGVSNLIVSVLEEYKKMGYPKDKAIKATVEWLENSVIKPMKNAIGE